MKWLITHNNEGCVGIGDIPIADYGEFCDDLCAKLMSPSCHVAAYFAHPLGNELAFFCLLLDDDTGQVQIASHRYEYYSEQKLASITARHPQMHPFEREITELYGVRFVDSPWNKPLRFPHNRASGGSCMDNYPFYSMEGDALHEVNVGPIHAGIIEPGAFRFICNGERVLHLEIALGYQHRGVETLMTGTANRLRQSVIAESIAGDSAVGHATAYASVIEKLTKDYAPNVRLDNERAVALELERIATHIADTGALCMDIGYQLGQVACEALRTIVINTTQLWCGNRFGKGLIRPMGSNFAMTGEMSEAIIKSIAEVRRRYEEVREDLKAAPSLLSRFEDCGTLSTQQLQTIGAVGLAARAGGLTRDVRATHPWGAWTAMGHSPETKEQGDIMSRLLLRGKEIFQSSDYIPELLRRISSSGVATLPDYKATLQGNSLSFSLVEGWRGEICHVALTDSQGNIEAYKVKDPSVHNWLALALSVRGEGISDFPLCNKSFNLSYCGHDL